MNAAQLFVWFCCSTVLTNSYLLLLISNSIFNSVLLLLAVLHRTITIESSKMNTTKALEKRHFHKMNHCLFTVNHQAAEDNVGYVNRIYHSSEVWSRSIYGQGKQCSEHYVAEIWVAMVRHSPDLHLHSSCDASEVIQVSQILLL